MLGCLYSVCFATLSLPRDPSSSLSAVLGLSLFPEGLPGCPASLEPAGPLTFRKAPQQVLQCSAHKGSPSEVSCSEDYLSAMRFM